ncbi:MAG: hypothetical protein U1B78_07470 [Dehalococcoidia bacterium]|nr:hypothetical protein [Dehalococcoidia bacterium]
MKEEEMYIASEIAARNQDLAVTRVEEIKKQMGWGMGHRPKPSTFHSIWR